MRFKNLEHGFICHDLTLKLLDSVVFSVSPSWMWYQNTTKRSKNSQQQFILIFKRPATPLRYRFESDIRGFLIFFFHNYIHEKTKPIWSTPLPLTKNRASRHWSQPFELWSRPTGRPPSDQSLRPANRPWIFAILLPCTTIDRRKTTRLRYLQHIDLVARNRGGRKDTHLWLAVSTCSKCFHCSCEANWTAA